ncbi:Uncharacterised protein [Mycobacterium tuberculosis]|nr:Uncharacterised protein [Mycobacterium tuberculosis]
MSYATGTATYVPLARCGVWHLRKLLQVKEKDGADP